MKSIMKQWSVRSRVIFLGIVPALAAMVVLSAMFMISGYTQLEEQLKLTGTAVARHLSTASEFGVLSGNAQVLSGLVDAALKEDSVIAVVISDQRGQQLAHAGEVTISAKSMLESKLSSEERNDSLLFQMPVYRTQLMVLNELESEFEDDDEPAMAKSEVVIGWVGVEVSQKSTRELQKMHLLRVAGVSLVIIIFSLLLARKIGQSLVEPIENLTFAVKELGRGNLDTRIDSHSGGEIKTLEQGFNLMADFLKDAQQGLQDKIDNATSKLRDTLFELEANNEQLEIERARASEANEAKSSFLANMSHELRTPLNAIIGYSEMLAEEAGELHQLSFVDDLGKIHGAGYHLLALINDILDLSKIEAGKMEVFPEHFDLSMLVKDVANTIQPLILKNNNDLRIVSDDSIAEMYTDQTKVKQTLFNLLSNASKFTDQGSIILNIAALSKDGQPWVEIKVQDSGIGMTEQQMAKLFTPFTQADASTTRKYGGTGLGLTISKRFCNMMGGDIAVDSVSGEGTTFTINLPLAVGIPEIKMKEVPVLPDPQKVRMLSSPKQAESRSKISTILVIDDDQAVRDLIQYSLIKEGFEVITASNGESGLKFAKEMKPDAITLDVMMPYMDGWSVLRKLKDDPELRDIPVVMVTAVTDKDIGYALGATDFITKPIAKERLLDVIKRCVRSHENEKVLVVEDDADTRELMQTLLEKNGWGVTTAENGRVGLECLQEEIPALILLDLMMPEVDGFEFIEELKAHEEWSSIPVIVLTSADLTAAEKMLLQGSVERIMNKASWPVSTLVKNLKQFLDSVNAA